MKQVLIAFAALFLLACTSQNSPNPNITIFNNAIEDHVYLLLVVYDGKAGQPAPSVLESKFKEKASLLCKEEFSFDKPDDAVLKELNRKSLEKWIAAQHFNYVAKSCESGFSTQSSSSATKITYCT
ncbi:hypothetical protein K6Q96_23790 [Grimontia kaedaensis]|uniref:Lipoprotein n=1 Tax=Grimontia kaedaensis TaxID=2872157 RepID=A0ABY4X0K3_9GAMM|nr:hypothetical protein [Grimontia kaedaensis]USH04738.1 hypothetical protein K6Q96_23790 [Grimontia kaedaensis]